MQEERGLVERAQRGDGEAFARLYEENFDRIYRYIALRVGSGADAEDLTAQVFLKAWESIASFRWRGVSFSAWLFRIARNLAIDHLRKEGRKGRLGDEPVYHLDPAVVAEKRLTIEQLVIAVEGLTLAQRDVIALRFAAGLSIAETAKVLGKREGAVKALQHSALVALRKRLYRWRNDEQGI